MSRVWSSVSAVLAVVILVSACGGDSRVREVQTGMSRDSALATLTGTPLAEADPLNADSLANVWRSTPYFVNGQRVEIVYYSPSGEKRTATDTVPDERIIPVVLVDGKVVGYGQSALDQIYERFPLPRNKY